MNTASVNDIATLIRKKFKDGEARLPVLPDAVLKVRAVIADERKGSTDIAKVISESPAFSAKALSVLPFSLRIRLMLLETLFNMASASDICPNTIQNIFAKLTKSIIQ